MISSADEVTLRQLVGSSTFSRARAYANGGAVKRREWVDGDTSVVGEIQGGAMEPYRASVELTRSPSAQLSALHAVCTCPVGVNCKHAVALLLAKDATAAFEGRPLTLLRGSPGPAATQAASRQGSSSAGWDVPLRGLLVGDEAEGAESAEIGLQFELVLAGTMKGRRSGAARPGIRVRPVISNRSGNWARAGISWSNLDYFSYGRPTSNGAAERLSLLKELLALSRLSSARGYSSYDTEVWLEEINTRRLWDLLREARDLQIPLLRSARNALPVRLVSFPATATIDITRAGPGLRLEPRVMLDGAQVPLGSSTLLGRPAHGIAWWGDDERAGARHAAAEGPQLCLAPFADPLDDTVRALLGREPIYVPERDEGRFLGEIYPLLRRRVAVRSSDESVTLPELAPTNLVLAVTHEKGHRISLAWSRGRVGTSWRERLWASRRGVDDRAAEDGALAAATALLDSMPALLEVTPWGERLAPVVELKDLAAVRFAELLPALSEIPGVEIEVAPGLPDYQEATEAPVVHLSGSQSRDGDWFDLEVEVTVGGEEVPFHQLFVALAEEQSHLILPSGTYFSLERDELRELAKLIAEARAMQEAPGEGIRLSRFQASLWEEVCRLGVVTAQATAWEAAVRGLTEATERSDHPAPEGLYAILRPYQQVGFNWLVFLSEHRLGGVLADDMGLGKTLQALALICHAKERGLASSPYLVIAPTSVVENWAAECRRFAPGLSVRTVSATERRRGVPLGEVAAADLVITSYALFRLEYDDYAALDWAGLFLDEAQFVKNHRSKTYQQVRMLPAPFKVAMTGTPMENNLMELWSLLSITAPGLFPRPDRFEEHYRVPIERHADSDRLAQLRRRISPLMLRRTKEQVAADLPDKQEQVLELDLNPKHERLYQTYLARERQKILGLIGDMSKNRFEIFRSLTLLRQASLDVSLIDTKHQNVPSTKLDALMEMLDTIVADGHRVLVFSQFTRFLGTARRRIEAAGIDHCYLDGRTRKRDTVISDFREGKAPVFLISLKAGGFGLNLTEADYCILLDPWWNPATEAQAVDRIHRIGQTRNVMVYRLVAKETIEEKVMALKAKKAALFANVVDAGGFESGALTAADIRALVS
ncbi:MAG: DEAD/DEAH box helicase [Acidimicrobiales bacterium]